MARYTTPSEVRLLIRAPKRGVKSWEDGEYDDLLDMCIASAELQIDDICYEWSPFDTTVVAESRSVVLDFNITEGLIRTDPFTVAPTSVEVDGATVDVDVTASVVPTSARSGKDLEVTSNYPMLYDRQTVTLVGGSWGWTKVPVDVKQAASRIAARQFLQMRRPDGIVDIAGGAMYDPRYDDVVNKLLAQYVGGQVV